MRTILIGTSKGGQGKSALSFNLSIIGQLEGYKVGLIDCDYQRTAHRLCLMREDEHPKRKQPLVISLHHPEERDLKGALLELREQGVDLVFIDVGGYQSGAMVDAGIYANLWLIPITPTLENFWGLEDAQETRKIIEADLGEETNWRLLLNVVERDSNKKLLAAFEDSAKRHKTPLLKTRINRWAAIPNGTFNGLSAAELQPSSKASKQLRALFCELTGEVK